MRPFSYTYEQGIRQSQELLVYGMRLELKADRWQLDE